MQRLHLGFPRELLVEIFRYYVALDDSPWRLTLVCKPWRRTVLTMPGLWTHIHITNEIGPRYTKWNILGSTKYSYGRAAVCLDAEELRAACHLSGTQLLHIQASLENQIDDKDPDFNDCMKEIFGLNLASRTFALHINMKCNPSKDIRFPGRLGPPTIQPLPSLEILCIESLPSEWMDVVLRTLATSSVRNLRRLELPKGLEGDRFLNKVARELGKLERLSGFHKWPNDSTPRTEMSSLRELDVTCPFIFLSRLRLPRLHTLDMWDTTPFQANSKDVDEPYHLYLPYLNKLNVVTQRPFWLERFMAPRVRILSIAGVIVPWITHGNVRLFTPDVFPSVKHFGFEVDADQIIVDGEQQDELILSALHAVPNAISLRIGTKPLPNDTSRLRLDLLKRLGETSEDTILCPRLRNIKLVSLGQFWMGLSDEELDLLRGIVEGRKQTDKPLRELIVEWTHINGDVISESFI
ncbi:hypothetical protein M408DRAFT_171356 [Serendipita vermifera MAFF 305830]|uniref:Uncharacterized protein n=1 Tax=Serendipita vermifera MAFF 305830 TaxID=933852 RepID=A0A0C3ARP2_SERVB|nr:hypothetical protein M408DRAFT_171356 [Serendipita vermifera MAFF 305830]